LMNFRHPTRSSSVRVPSWATGWYLFATDERFAADSAFPAIGYVSPGSVPPPSPSATVAFSVAGAPVAGPPAPRVRLRTRLVVRHGRLIVGRVRYARPCRVHVILQGSHSLRIVDLKLPHSGPIALHARRAPAGELKLSVSVDDGPPVTGRARAS
jgi:hypothetical protein